MPPRAPPRARPPPKGSHHERSVPRPPLAASPCTWFGHAGRGHFGSASCPMLRPECTSSSVRVGRPDVPGVETTTAAGWRTRIIVPLLGVGDAASHRHTAIPPSIIPARPCRSRDSVPPVSSRCHEPLGWRLGSSLFSRALTPNLADSAGGVRVGHVKFKYIACS